MRKILALLLLSLPFAANAAITWRFTGVADNATADGVTDPTLGPVGADPDLTLGGTTNAGDLIVCGVAQKTGDYANISAPGYTNIGGKNNTSGGTVAALCKIATGGDAAPDITSTDETSGRTLIGQCAVFAGAQASCTDIVAHVVTDENTDAQDDIDVSALAVTTDNTLVVYVAAKAQDFQTEDAVIGASDALTELGQPERTSSAQIGLVWAYRIQTTAATVTPGNVTLGANVANGMSIGLSLKPAVSVPTLSSVSVTGRTASSVTVSYTSDQAGTTYTARATVDQTAPTCDELEAQTYASAVSYASEATSGGADSIAHTGLTNGTARDFYICVENSGGTDSAVTLIENVYKIPDWTSAPVVSAQGTGDYTIAKDLDGAGSTYAVACVKDSTAPTYAQVAAGNCTGDAAAIASASGDGTSATLALGSGLTRPVHDIYVVGTYGSQESAVTTLADECLDAPTGKQLVNCPAGLTSIDSGSPIVTFNASATPDIAVGDIPVVDLTTTPGGCDVTPTATGLYSYPGSCGPSAQYHDWTFYDLSVGAMHADTMRAWTNNSAPQASVTSIDLQVVEGAAVAPITYSDLVTDADGHAITCTTQDTGTGTGEGKRPAGTTTTAGVFDGTYTTAGSGSFGMLCTDPAGEGRTITTTWLVVAPGAIPQCVGETLTSCLDLMSAAYIDVTATFECSFTVPALEVMSQDPASPTVVDPFTESAVVVSRGVCGNRAYKRLGIGIQIGL